MSWGPAVSCACRLLVHGVGALARSVSSARALHCHPAPSPGLHSSRNPSLPSSLPLSSCWPSTCWCFLFWQLFFIISSVSDGEGIGTPHQHSCLENPMDGGAWWAAVHGVAQSRTRLSDFASTFHFRALEKDMATHSSVLAWRIPGMAEPGGLPSVGSHRVGHDWSNVAAAAVSLISFF